MPRNGEERNRTIEVLLTIVQFLVAAIASVCCWIIIEIRADLAEARKDSTQHFQDVYKQISHEHERISDLDKRLWWQEQRTK